MILPRCSFVHDVLTELFDNDIVLSQSGGMRPFRGKYTRQHIQRADPSEALRCGILIRSH